ncbi:MAG TPA: hypothetical protein VF719_12985 [Abditibacteriaceae bacterium]
MNKIKNGLIIIVAGILLNLLGRLIIPVTRANPNAVVASLMAIWMIASVVLVLFGLFRVIVGLVTKNRSPKVQ